ncbi:MAG: hypothetical protein HY914_17755 [Desulfomonile tiedjei]|nr:hypothetical protein [Desulfomonile tiedjei]
MERAELLKKLSDARFEHFQALGLPPFKCQQLVADRLGAWKKMTTEELQELLERGEESY